MQQVLGEFEMVDIADHNVQVGVLGVVVVIDFTALDKVIGDLLPLFISVRLLPEVGNGPRLDIDDLCGLSILLS